MGAGSGTGSGLKRLAKLYGMVENLHAMQLRAAAGAVDEVDEATARMHATRRDEVSQGRLALAHGSRVESMAVEKTAAANEARHKVLGRMKVERKDQHAAAGAAHRASRMERRQIDGVVERARVAAELEGERRAQGTSDDRFLSRREWMRAKELRERA
jgi:hypothetical protein